MGITNFLVQKYGAQIVVDAIKASFPPALAFLDALGTGTVADAVAAFLDEYKKFMATQPPSTSAVDWEGYSRRFLTEKPADKVFLDFFRDIGMAEIAGIDVDALFEELVKAK